MGLMERKGSPPPPPSPEQRVALDVWNSGENQVCVASAGAGKSTLLLHACAASDDPVLIVTYNKALQREMEAKIQCPHACFTFHGLASAYFSVAPDDATLHAILNSGVQMKHAPPFKRVCIDEAQDLKDVYVALLRVMFDVDHVQWMVVGDPTQLLNDFDPDDPARISFMQQPADSFGAARAWQHTRLGTSHRLTDPIVRIANGMLDPDIPYIVAGGRRDHAPVHICTTDPYNCADIVVKWIKAVHERDPGAAIMVLVSRRRGNAAISTIVNSLTRVNVGVYVHGHDCESSAHPSKVTIVSWHASKGLQCDASIVIGVEDTCAHNPLHVALTRSRQYMLIVNNARRPNRRLIEALVDDPALVRLDEATRSLVRHGVPAAPDQEATVRSPSAVRDLSAWNMIGRGNIANSLIVCAPQITNYPPSAVAGEEAISATTSVDTSGLYLTAVLLKHEYSETGTCRILEFMLNPTTSSRVDRASFYDNPSHTYVLAPGARESNLLPPYAFELMRRITNGGSRSVADWLNLAVMVDGFCGYHHTMGSMLPCDAWRNDDVFAQASNCLTAHMASMDKPVTYDTRWCRDVDGTALHRRCFATTPTVAFSVMYGDSITPTDRARACLVATLHPTLTRAGLLNLKTGTRHIYAIRDKLALIKSLVSI